jgi:moderate conductance mechanosensitive channel
MTDHLSNWIDKLIPWLLTDGLQIVFIIIGAIIINKITCKFIEKAVRITIVPDHLTTPEGEIKREVIFFLPPLK